MKKHICTHCGEEFTGKKRKYCNDKCRYEYNKVRKRKQYRLDNNIKSRSCPICDKEFEPNRKGALTKYCSQNCADEARRIRNRERWRAANPGWDEGTNKVCEWCGKSYEVKPKYASQSRFCSYECQQTWYSRSKGHMPLEEYKTLLEKQKKETTERNERQRLIKKIYQLLKKEINIREKEIEKQNRIDLLTRECVECGEMFYNPSPKVLTCSTECSRKRSRRISRTIYKGRINDSNLVDINITLTKLYKRYEGMCYLCGIQCDWNDKVITDKGHTIVGKSYPSIEHVIPLSKGGKHSWNNVKLACMECNTLKSDKIINIKGKKAIV